MSAAFWAWSERLDYLPIGIIAFGIFIAAIWVVNGIVWSMQDRD